MSNNFKSRILILAGIMLVFVLPAAAQSKPVFTGGMLYFIYGIIAFVIFAFSLAVYFIIQNNKFQKISNEKAGRLPGAGGLRQWWNRLDQKYFTRAASLEKEADVLLDHDYDGIKELDNALPPWWKWGFYITVVLAVIYMFRFHILKTGPTPLEEYTTEMKIAENRLENFRRNSKDVFDEKTVTMADAAGIAAGKKIFAGTCFPCHGAVGEGNAVGPNLTDKFWLHGGSLGDVFKTITNGVPDKGMQAWGKTYSPSDIKNLSSFILSLQGTNPPNAKAAQGTPYEPGKPAVSDTTTVVKKDTLKAQPAK
jgi:cytochrome c oxidase cbb3-type subunit III